MSENAEARDVYAARIAGWPGFCAVMADDPKWRKETAKELASWVRDGREIERVTRSEAVAGLEEYSAEKKRRKAQPRTAEASQDGLFAFVSKEQTTL